MVSSVGSVVYLKHIIFKTDGLENHYVIDHAYYRGRPAVVICETEDYIYHLLMTNKNSNVPNFYDYKIRKVSDGITGFVKFNEIHTRPLCYEEEIMHLSDKDLLNVLKGFYQFQTECVSDEEFEAIKPFIEQKIEELEYNKKFCLKK